MEGNQKLYQDGKTTIEFKSGKSVFICGKCGQPGTQNPIYIEEGNKKIRFHFDCVYPTLKKLKIKLPDELKEKKVGKVGKENIKGNQLSIIKNTNQLSKNERLKVKKEKLYNILNSDPEKRLIKRYTKKGNAKIIWHNEGIYLDHPYNDKLNAKYKFIGHLKFDSLLKKWEVKKVDDIEVCRFLLEITDMFPEYQWSIDPKALEVLEKNVEKFKEKVQTHKDLVKLKKQQNIQLEDWSDYLRHEPFGYQKVGIKFLEMIDGVGMVGDEMGLGKTLQALGYTAKNNLKTIIVCPASVKYNWYREVKKHTYKDAILITDLEKPTKRQEDLLKDYNIINYEQLQKYEKFLKVVKFDCVILDESQYIKNSQSQRTRLVKKIFKDKKTKRVKHRILLSGTAIKNKPIEFYSQLNLLRPDLFKTKESFGLRYCDAQESSYGRGFDYNGASNLRELYLKLESFYIRRLKSKVLKDLPEKTVNRLEFELTTKERNEYLKLCKNFRKDYVEGEGSGSGGKALSKGVALTKIVKIKQFLSKTKIPLAVNFVKELLEQSESKKVIIFSNVRESQKELVEIFGDLACSLLGDYSQQKRDAQVEEFENNPKKRVFIGSTLAAGVGINLVSADTVIFLDLMWNPADHQQAEDRAFRIGQKNAVSVYYLNYLNTIESMLWSILEKKLEIMGQVLDGKESKEEKEDLDEKTVVNKFLNQFLDSLELKK